jgi:hypothetical protein
MAPHVALEFNTPSVAAAMAVAGKGISRNMQSILKVADRLHCINFSLKY